MRLPLRLRALSIDTRQATTVVLMLTFLLGVLVVHGYTLPAMDRLVRLRQACADRQREYDTLAENLMLADQIDRQFEQLQLGTSPPENDEIVLSDLLADLEQMVRNAGLTLVNMQPTDVRDAGAVRRYEVRLSVAGRLPEVVRFSHDMTTGQWIVGTRDLRLRATRGWNTVDCTFQIHMLRLMPRPGETIVPDTERETT